MSTTTTADSDQVASKGRHPTARQRRKAKKPPPPLQFYGLAVIIAILVGLGLVMVLSASSVLSLHTDGSAWTYFIKQAMWTVLGVGALLITAKIPYHFWRPLIPVALFGAFALMVLVLMPGIGVTVNGARSWIRFGYFAVQPAEVLKFALLLYCADLLARRADRMHELRATLYPMLVVLGLSGVLLMLQPDLGGALVMASIVLGVAFIAGTPLIPLGATAGLASAVGMVFVMKADYRRERWLAFLDLAQHKQDAGFQVWQSLIGIASGGVTGVGLGASKLKWGYLPEAHTDFIFAIIAEELGFVGVVAVCGLFCAFGLLGVQVALRAKDRFGMLIAGGVTAWVLTQALINIGGVVGMMPLTGLTLPFVSFGGSSLLVMMAAGGLLLNVARTGAMKQGAKTRADGPLFIIAGGGTAGHVMPGLAVAEALVEGGHPRDRVHFIGARRGMEATMVPAAGFSVSLFDVRGIARSPTPSNLPAFYNLSGGIRRADRLFRRIEPSVVVSVGGYASVPAVMAAKIQRIPVLVVSYDVVPGKASRLAARLATVSAVAFESSPLPRKVVTGVPLRPEILAIDRHRDRDRARFELRLPLDRFVVLIVGGSLGSGALNTLASGFVAAQRERRDLAVHHVYGNRNDDGSWQPLDVPEGLIYHPVAFEHRMDLAYAAADLVVARAGATTVAELAALGVPSILVPWPQAAEDHQTANARALAGVGGALLVPEPELDADRLGREVDRLRADPQALADMSSGARSAGRRGAAAAIARLAEELALGERDL